MKEELDNLKAERERENARNRSNVAEAEEHRKANVRQRRLEGGSRFNLRYPAGVPAEALSPDAVRSALAPYLEFGDMESPAAAVPLQPGSTPSNGGLPRKGMLLQEADAMLGNPAATVSERRERFGFRPASTPPPKGESLPSLWKGS